MSQWEDKLKDIFCKRLAISEIELDNMKNEYLFGKKVDLPVREAILIYVDIENMLGCRLPEDQILDGGFETYDKIKNLVAAQME